MALKIDFLSGKIMPFWEKLWKCEKTQRYKTCYNRKKKKLFGIRTTFSYYKVSQRKNISNRNEEN